MVAAFVGNQLRGVASVQEVAVGPPYPYLAFLTIYGATAPRARRCASRCGTTSECKLYNATDESHPFVANSSIGTHRVRPTRSRRPRSSAAGTLTIAVNEGLDVGLDEHDLGGHERDRGFSPISCPPRGTSSSRRRPSASSSTIRRAGRVVRSSMSITSRATCSDFTTPGTILHNGSRRRTCPFR